MENLKTALEKLETIAIWFAQNAKETPAVFNQEVTIEMFTQIENLLGEALPPVFKSIYSKYNGEEEKGIGSFLGHSFLSLKQIIINLEYAKTLAKPLERHIPKPEDAQKIIDQIISIIKSNHGTLPAVARFGK